METPAESVLSGEAVSSYPSLAGAFGLVGLTLLFQLGAVLIIKLVGLFIPALGDEAAYLAYPIGMGAALWFAVKKRKSTIFPSEKVPPVIYLALLPISIALVLLASMLGSFIPMPEFFKNFFSKETGVLGILIMVVAAPLLEEFIFRGVVLDGFLKRYSRDKAILLSSLLFGLAHLNPWQFIMAFALGLLSGWFYWKTRSIIPSILMHAIANSFAVWVRMQRSGFEAVDTQVADNPLVFSLVITTCIVIGTFGMLLCKGILEKK
ncbi:MAG: CPBP family intramembrane metalloprotease [bacterium]|nr:CPBP family intramembrane metalloprotease [bacterium]